MLLSMTSYGRATQTFGRKNIVVELKTLNSKYLDLRMKAPSNLLERELPSTEDDIGKNNKGKN